MDDPDFEHEIAANEGYGARMDDLALDQCPYDRGSQLWRQWRDGWAFADNQLWQGVLMDKRKAASE